MSNKVGESLALIVTAQTAVLRRGSTDTLEVLLDEKVVWNGMFPEIRGLQNRLRRVAWS